MGKKGLNPADVERRKEAERRKKANAETRRAQRDASLKKKSEEELKEEIQRIKRLGQEHNKEITQHHAYTTTCACACIFDRSILFINCCVCLSVCLSCFCVC